MTDTSWTVEQLQPNVHRILWRAPGIRANGNQLRVLVTADRHIDSPDSDRAMQKRHLEEAAAIGAPVIDLGDVFDAMNTRYDGRRMPSHSRREIATRDDYVTAIVDDAAKFFGPYSSQLAVIARGNHETAITKHAGIDLLSALVYQMKAENPACPAHLGGYGGWIFLTIADTDDPKRRGWRSTTRVKYYHGSGGGGPVTKGTIQANRRAVFLPDADVILSGHIHEEWAVTYSRERITDYGRIRLDEQLHVSVPSYKEEYRDGSGGWHVERGAPPKPIGATWLTLTMRNDQVAGVGQYKVDVDAVRAR